MRKIVFIYLFTAFFSLQALETIHIAIVTDGKTHRVDQLREEVINEVNDLLSAEYDIEFSDSNKFKGDWTIESVNTVVNRALYSSEVDYVITLGVIASNVVSHKPTLPKPTIAPFIINAAMQHVPSIDGHSGIHNLNYLTFPSDISRDLEIFQELSPYQNIAILIDETISKAIPNFNQNMEEIVYDSGVKVKIITMNKYASDAFLQIPTNVDAVYVTPMIQMSPDELENLASGLVERKLPSFSMFAKDYIDSGFLASMSPDSDMSRLSRRIALNIQRELSGEKLEDLSVELSDLHQLAINMKTAKELDIHIPWDLLHEANLINSEENLLVGTPLPEAVDIALCDNRLLEASRRVVSAGKEDVNAARARLFPRIDGKLLARKIDKDRAILSLGTEPEKAVKWTIDGSQILYSNKLYGNYQIQKKLQCARKYEYRDKRIELIANVSTTYINLLRAKTLERIQNNNYMLTRSNLRRANQREEVGVARASEVYRWESEMSSNKSQVIDARFQIKIIEAEINRLLNRPQDLPFIANEVTLDDPYWMVDHTWFEDHVRNDETLELFSKFAIEQGMKYSPEIQKMYYTVCAQSKKYGVARREIWSPTIAILGEISDKFYTSGTGTEFHSINDDRDWAIGIQLTIPIYRGGEQVSDKYKACHELWEKVHLLEATVEALETEIRSSIYSATSSYATIALSKESAITARKNLKLVSDAYTKGTVPIVTLLDAQNQALIADLITANAVYDYLIDIVNLQSAIGKFDFNVNNKDYWTREFKHYFQIHRKVQP